MSKTILKPSPALRRTHRTVDEMLRANGHQRVAEAVKGLSAKTRLVDRLIIARVKSGLTQTQLAGRLKCSQSRVSKLEDSVDADLTLGEVQAYARGVGIKVEWSLLGG